MLKHKVGQDSGMKGKYKAQDSFSDIEDPSPEKSEQINYNINATTEINTPLLLETTISDINMRPFDLTSLDTDDE